MGNDVVTKFFRVEWDSSKGYPTPKASSLRVALSLYFNDKDFHPHPKYDVHEINFGDNEDEKKKEKRNFPKPPHFLQKPRNYCSY